MARPATVISKAIDDLRKHLRASFTPGERIPSVRTLAAMFGIGHATVQRALCALDREKCVRRGARRRWLMTGRPASPVVRRRVRIAIISRLPRQGWRDSLMYAALQEQAERDSVDLLEIPFERRSRSTPARSRFNLRMLPWNDFDVGMLVDIHDPVMLGDPILRQRKVLSIDLDARNYGLDSVIFDNHAAGAAAANHLCELGHRRFAVADEINEVGWACDEAWTSRRHCFEAAATRMGGCIRPEWRVPISRTHNDDVPGDIARVLKHWSELAPRRRPTAMFTFDDYWVPELIAQLPEFGFRVPQNFSFVNLTWNPEGPRKAGTQLTTIQLDLKLFASRALKAAREKVCIEKSNSDNMPRAHLVPITLIPGGSTASPH